MRSALTIERIVVRHSLLTEVLHELGFPVVIAAVSVENALERMLVVAFDVIFVEVKHARDPTFDFVRRVRFGAPDARRTPIIVMCSDTSLPMVEKARDSGANGLMTKPFSRASVGLQVTRALNHKRPFITTATFAGPDRRRWNDPDYRGPERRSAALATHLID